MDPTEELKVTHACSHTGIVSGRYRDLRIRRAAGTLCSACIKQHVEERTSMIAASSTRSHEIVSATRLTGSVRQIEWAERIRSAWRDHAFGRGMLARSVFSNAEDRVHPEEIERAVTNVLAARIVATERVLAKMRAAEWIDQSKHQILEEPIRQAADEAQNIEMVRLNRLMARPPAA